MYGLPGYGLLCQRRRRAAVGHRTRDRNPPRGDAGRWSISLETARCLGACGIAPVVVFDGEVCGKQEPEMVRERVKGWLSRGPE